MSNLRNNYSDLYNDIKNKSSVNSINSLNDCAKLFNNMSLGNKLTFVGNNNLLISNTPQTLGDNSYNVCIGSNSLTTLDGINSCSQNTCIGGGNLQNIRNSNNNTTYGYSSLGNPTITDSSLNTSFGTGSAFLKNAGSGCLFVGANCSSLTTNNDDIICIGSDSNNVINHSFDNSICLGNQSNIISSNSLFIPQTISDIPNGSPNNSLLLFDISNGKCGPAGVLNNGFIKLTSNVISWDSNTSSIIPYQDFMLGIQTVSYIIYPGPLTYFGRSFFTSYTRNSGNISIDEDYINGKVAIIKETGSYLFEMQYDIYTTNTGNINTVGLFYSRNGFFYYPFGSSFKTNITFTMKDNIYHIKSQITINCDQNDSIEIFMQNTGGVAYTLANSYLLITRVA